MKSWYLYVLVFVAGAAVLAVEILGTRILGPFYGVSLFLWSALITVTLAALSVGYAVGGRWADRGPKLSRLCYAMAGAGLWLLAIPWLKQPVLAVAEPFGLRFAVLVAALILFAPPLTLLGMVGPYAIRLKAARLDEVGRTAGDLYAISTIASVVAALLTGFFLIPIVGVRRLTLMIGLALLLSAGIGLLAHRRWRVKAPASMGMVLLGAALLWLLPTDAADPERGLLAVEQSAYAEIRVLERDGSRYLLIDGGTHTIVDPATWASSFPYVAVMDLTRDFFAQPGRMLLVGLGGGTLVKNFARAGWQVDAVEIDPVITRIARQYFGLADAEGRIYHVDGRRYLTARADAYDVIIMDAFGSSSIPFHLVTQESFGLIAARLNPGGVFAINVEATGWEDLIVRSLAATLGRHFSHVLAVPTYTPSDALGNVVLLAAHHDLSLPVEQPSEDPAFRQHRAWNRRFAPDVRGAPILTDDLNPVDVWSEAINVLARKDLHAHFGEDGRNW